MKTNLVLIVLGLLVTTIACDAQPSPTPIPTPTSTPTPASITIYAPFAGGIFLIPPLQLIAPNGKEVIVQENVYEIRWNASAQIVGVYLLLCKPVSQHLECNNIVPENMPVNAQPGRYSWKVLAEPGPYTLLIVEAGATGRPPDQDLSDHFFHIIAP